MQLAVQRMLLQLHTSRMFFRLRVTGTVSSVTATLLTSPGAAALFLRSSPLHTVILHSMLRARLLSAVAAAYDSVLADAWCLHQG